MQRNDAPARSTRRRPVESSQTRFQWAQTKAASCGAAAPQSASAPSAETPHWARNVRVRHEGFAAAWPSPQFPMSSVRNLSDVPADRPTDPDEAHHPDTLRAGRRRNYIAWVDLPGEPARNASRSILRPRDRRDITVPIGTDSTSAISL